MASRPTAEVELAGLGAHSGVAVRVRLRRARAGDGIVFARRGRPKSAFRAGLDRVLRTEMHTVIGDDRWHVATVEHLLSACHGLGVFDLRVDLDGDELPLLDGSAQPWVEALGKLGLPDGVAPPARRVIRPVEVREDGRLARLEPFDGCVLRCELTLRPEPQACGPQPVELSLDPRGYAAQIAWARTFVCESDVDRLRAAGYGKGADLGNTLVLGAGGPVNPGGLRGPSEPTRHKLLDALGDLGLCGHSFRGRLVLRDSSHRLHVALARAWLAS